MNGSGKHAYRYLHRTYQQRFVERREKIAREHAEADARAGKAWTCACRDCRRVREKGESVPPEG